MKAGKINAKWHSAHRMPPGATRTQRVRWHADHEKACGCRPVPPSLKADVAALTTGAQSS